jgi:hypothetical protein
LLPRVFRRRNAKKTRCLAIFASGACRLGHPREPAPHTRARRLRRRTLGEARGLRTPRDA